MIKLFNKFVYESKRVVTDVIIAVLIVLVYLSNFYQNFPAPLQLVSIKILLVSMGFIHAHVTRKLAFPKINWNEEGINAKSILVTALYIIFIYAYSIGG